MSTRENLRADRLLIARWTHVGTKLGFQNQLVLSAQGTIIDEIWLFQLSILSLICE